MSSSKVNKLVPDKDSGEASENRTMGDPPLARGPAESATGKQKTPSDPPSLSNEYHKARKQLLLWAAILFIWELVGIDLSKVEAAGGNIGGLVSAIKSPQAVPWVLGILVAYFLFKCTVEWLQCAKSRRRLRVSKVDFISAWVVAMTGYAVYGYQAFSRVQIADVLQQPNKLKPTLLGLITGATYTVVAFAIRARWSYVRSRRGTSLTVILLSLVSLAITIAVGIILPAFWVIGLFVGFLPFGLVIIIAIVLDAWYRLYGTGVRDSAELSPDFQEEH